jgi:phage terminase small subunit
VAAKRPPLAKKKAGSNPDAAALRRKVFAQAYIANGGNKTEAAKKAGFSERTAYAQGSRLFKHVEVQALIAQSAEKLARKYELTTDLVVRSLVQELTFDPANLYDEAGRLRAITELDADTRSALVGVEITEEVISGAASQRQEPQAHGGSLKRQTAPQAVLRTAKVKWAAKQGAREQAMKHLGMFAADNKQRNPLDGLPHEVLVALRDGLKKQLGLA